MFWFRLCCCSLGVSELGHWICYPRLWYAWVCWFATNLSELGFRVCYSRMSWLLMYGASNQAVQTYLGRTSWIYQRLNSTCRTILFWKAQLWVVKQRVKAQNLLNCSSLKAQFWVASLYVSKGLMILWNAPCSCFLDPQKDVVSTLLRGKSSLHGL
ncbi:hypothetical protein HanIR_Chr11g0531641 [Helianthus annuus]|nr:hypothetical protein HanIR_Chr11g0531641 [Helianthus annuus]